MDKNDQPRILIVDTQPYNKMVQSRALDSYFHQFDCENLVQIFSDARIPCKGHCCKLFQITDKSLVKARLSKKQKAGKLFNREDLNDYWENGQPSSFRPKTKGPFYRLLRKYIWKEKYWNTRELNNFVDSFKPDYIFVGFSKDFFIFDISIYFAEKYKIPLILSIADDYVFYDEYQHQFLNSLYRKKYLKLINKLMSMDVHCIFESNKIMNKYKNEFNVKGDVVYISSDIVPTIRSANVLNGDWYYFGNLEYGRFDSLASIAIELANKGVEKKVIIYSNDSKDFLKKTHLPNLEIHDAVSYDKMLEIMETAGALLIVEGFKEKDVKMVEYSLSTKVGDCLAFGKPIIAFGDKRCGSIEFLLEQKVGYIAYDITTLNEKIDLALCGKDSSKLMQNQFETARNLFSLEIQSTRFLNLFCNNK